MAEPIAHEDGKSWEDMGKYNRNGVLNEKTVYGHVAAKHVIDDRRVVGKGANSLRNVTFESLNHDVSLEGDAGHMTGIMCILYEETRLGIVQHMPSL